ncbi:cellulase family glycosylhydrolase [Mycolicibacterium sp. 120266]|uniref:cellulase family glycosylhydrolase n=1 Tax=Mycolicibacterium sp. 120266 TaxID=3090601 RepID=UPI00299D2E89|nr:cellulase family glycosylhydrolase [Mycolicibacterium sp. 120266]MDX1875879.1 cellulase family glycosylhydrolase [Mycolicibacterium sp. 120266]
MTTAAIVAAAGSHFTMPAVHHTAAYQVQNTAAIAESSTTVGIADSNIYFEGTIEDIKKRLDLIQSVGATNVRLMVPWLYIQTQDPAGGAVDWNADLDWDKLDMIVGEVARRGMGILGVLQWSPDWATDGATGTGHPTNVQDFADFAAAVARRYGDKISAYEVWNEPNASFFWNPADPVEYTEMLKATYTSLKAVNQDITVVGAVVGAGLTWGELTMNPVDFVKAMYDAGADGYFDAISFHPYNFTTKFSEGNDVDWKELMPLFQVEQIRELMDQHIDPGEEQLKIWISEYGLPTSVVSASTQAEFITDLINTWQTFSGAGPIFLYTTQDDLSAIGDDRFFGLFDANGNPKDAAALKQLKRLIDCLDGCSATNPLASLLEFVGQLVSNVLSFVPNLVATVVNSVVNVVKQLVSAIGGLLGGQPSAPALSAARAGASIDAAIAEDVAPDAAGDETAAAASGEPAADEKTVDDKAKDKAEAVSAEVPAAEGTVAEEPAATQPVVAEPVPAEPVVTEPVVTDPVVTESETPSVTEESGTTTEPGEAGAVAEPSKPQTSAPEVTTPQTTKPEPTAPETKPEASTPESTKPETSASGAPKSEASTPEATKPDTAKPDTGKPDSAKPDSTKPDSPTVKSGHGTAAQTGPKPRVSDKPRHGAASAPAATTASQRESDAVKSGAASSGAGGSE